MPRDTTTVDRVAIRDLALLAKILAVAGALSATMLTAAALLRLFYAGSQQLLPVVFITLAVGVVAAVVTFICQLGLATLISELPEPTEGPANSPSSDNVPDGRAMPRGSAG